MSKPLLAAILLCLVGAGAQAQTPSLPQGREPGAAPYDPFARGKPAPVAPPAAEPATPGFRITVPLCRRAQQANDPLAKTVECETLLKAADDQARACQRAFEAGDDKAAMSAACRQAAGFR